MSDQLFPLPIQDLLHITLRELDHKDSYFGIPSQLFFDPAGKFQNNKRSSPGGSVSCDRLRSELFGQTLHTPIGVAAGPHSQMAQNIVAAWLLGASYIELKTVQTLDELEVPKPCIDMQDEGYNCEWSQELKIQQSADEYINAWIIIHLLNHRLGRKGVPGLIFNMSVGYNMDGIMQDNVQWFFRQMADCSGVLAGKLDAIRPLYPAIDEVDIPTRLSDNVTLSTMHGCPAHEIEQIATHLISDQGLHTYVKLNPTLLGPDRLRKILNEQMGFSTVVPDQAFEHDLKYEDALRIIGNLRELGKRQGREFGLKLTNTLESLNKRDVFPPGVEQMYMSGRALHPLSVNLAHKLQQAFDGKLQLSFSGGADAFNLSELLACGFKTVTACTDLLKPGGMMRLPQYIGQVVSDMQELGATSLDELITQKAASLPARAHGESKEARSPENGGGGEAALSCLAAYAADLLRDSRWKVDYLLPPDIKTTRKLGLFDCISAPCRDACATHQDIPEYMYYTARKEFEKAHGVILQTNPFPRVTGMICDHLCQNKCTRVHYDDPLLIREVKRFNSLQAAPTPEPAPGNGLRVSVIGAGPAGLSCAYFLAMAGFSVDVYEKASKAGGMVQYAIPGFRLTDEAMESDLARIRSLGVSIHYETPVDKQMFDQLKNRSDYLFVGTGAPLSTPLTIEGIESAGVLDPLDFLFRVREGEAVKLGRHVVIIGGGNTAMDAARTAYRLVDHDGAVTIVYRRTVMEMPADHGEIRAAMDEGIQIMALCGPEKVVSKGGKVQALRCQKMALGEADSSGRPRPVPIEDSQFDIPCDTIIPAIGQLIHTGFMDEQQLQTGTDSHLTRMDNVFTGGDAMRGAATAIKAIGDGRKAAMEITRAAGLSHQWPRTKKEAATGAREIMLERARRKFAPPVRELPPGDRKHFKLVQSALGQEEIVREASRCLQCDELCNSCVTVCPNLANYAASTRPVAFNLQKAVRSNGQDFSTEPDGHFAVEQEVQILNIADFCNECGNCRTFCPTADAPYKVKPTLHLGIASFYDSDEGYYLSQLESATNLIGKENGVLCTLSEREKEYVFETSSAITTLSKTDFRILSLQFLQDESREVRLHKAAEMLVIMQCAKDLLSGGKN